MIEIVIAVGGALVGAAWIVRRVRDRGGLQSVAALRGGGVGSGSWENAARDAGLEVLAGSLSEPGALTAQAGEHRILIEDIGTSQAPGTRIVIEGRSGISLSLESLASTVEKGIGRREIVLGDEAFDREVYIRGPAEMVRALLDAPRREQWRRLLRGWMRVDVPGVQGLEAAISLSDGDLRAEFRREWHDKLASCMPEVLALLLAVARGFEKPDDVASRIAENTRSEPEWRVRSENLRMLGERYPEDPATREASKLGCQDQNEEVRLRAALNLKDEGRGTLLEIASREEPDDALAATAVAALSSHLALDTAISILDGALSSRRQGTARACLAVLGQRGDAVAVDRLARVLVEDAPDLAVAAAQALAATGVPAAEAPLLQALKDLPVVSTAAAQALGRVGSMGAVLPLKEAAAREEVPDTLQRAVRQAIAEIQARLGGAPGQISLAEGDAGQLSLAEEDASGRVSLTKPDPGGKG